MVDKNIIQSRFTKLGVVPIDNQHYLYATLDNNLTGIIVVIKTCDKHYYDEEDIDIGKPVSCKVVVNHTVELTEEEKAEARRNAIRKAESEAYAKLAKAKSKPKKIEDNKLMPSLF
ncbi:Cas9 inhibitor AcrIIA9 family protein [Bacteroides ovatus]|uniref:Cas9 inhibitor AcrIIA9 family protein n=1 Tax=Bacteroides TaxID=816 RepID=UPI001F00AB2E|nr:MULTISPECIES: Cas9 inhibitor AcrIIA9 family protein [Bacteroides]